MRLSTLRSPFRTVPPPPSFPLGPARARTSRTRPSLFRLLPLGPSALAGLSRRASLVRARTHTHTHAHAQAHTHAHAGAHTHAHTPAHTHARVRTHTLARTHSHTPAPPSPFPPFLPPSSSFGLPSDCVTFGSAATPSVRAGRGAEFAVPLFVQRPFTGPVCAASGGPGRCAVNPFLVLLAEAAVDVSGLDLAVGLNLGSHFGRPARYCTPAGWGEGGGCLPRHNATPHAPPPLHPLLPFGPPPPPQFSHWAAVPISIWALTLVPQLCPPTPPWALVGREVGGVAPFGALRSLPY